MATTKIANIIDPEIVGEVAVAEFENKSVLAGSGAMEIDQNSEVKAGGQRVLIPRWNLASSAWQALSESTPMTARGVSSTPEYGVVVRRGDLFAIQDTAKIVSAQDPNAEVGRQVGENVTDGIDSTFIQLLAGATPAANRISNTGANITVSNIVDLKLKLGDRLKDLSILVLHSKQFGDLLKAKEVTYKDAAEIMPGTGITGEIPTIMGTVILISDKITVTAGSPNTYTAIGLGRGALYLGYQREVLVETDRDIAQLEDYIGYSLHFVPHLRGVSYTGATLMPEDTDLANTANWTRRAAANKLVKAASIVTR